MLCITSHVLCILYITLFTLYTILRIASDDAMYFLVFIICYECVSLYSPISLHSYPLKGVLYKCLYLEIYIYREREIPIFDILLYMRILSINYHRCEQKAIHEPRACARGPCIFLLTSMLTYGYYAHTYIIHKYFLHIHIYIYVHMYIHALAHYQLFIQNGTKPLGIISIGTATRPNSTSGDTTTPMKGGKVFQSERKGSKS